MKGMFRADQVTLFKPRHLRDCISARHGFAVMRSLAKKPGFLFLILAKSTFPRVGEAMSFDISIDIIFEVQTAGKENFQGELSSHIAGAIAIIRPIKVVNQETWT